MKIFLLIAKLLIELVARTNLNAEPWAAVFVLLLNVYDLVKEIVENIKKHLGYNYDSGAEDSQDLDSDTNQDENL